MSFKIVRKNEATIYEAPGISTLEPHAYTIEDVECDCYGMSHFLLMVEPK